MPVTRSAAQIRRESTGDVAAVSSSSLVTEHYMVGSSGSGNNRERLQAAGVLNPEATLTSQEADAIESLTDGEVKQLIKIREKVGDYSHSRHGGCAWIL